MLNDFLMVLVSLFSAVAGTLIFGSRHWDSGTRKLRARLDAARMTVRPLTVDWREIEGLAEPVQRFFRTALTEEQPLVAEVRLRHVGTFNTGETVDRWKPFTSDQRVVTKEPGFDWNGRISMLPGFPIRVHDAYIARKGLLHASLLGLFSLAHEEAGGALAEGELMRFLAEATWYPSALLPSQGVQWDPVDDHSARATLNDGDISVALLFSFNTSGLIESVRTEERGRLVDGKMIPTPWEGRFWNYKERDGMHVPFDGEVSWILKTGAKPYWRGHVTHIKYDFAQ